MNDSHTPDPRTLETSPVPRSKPVNPVRRLTLVVIAVGLVLFVYGMLSDRLTPFTSQATVRLHGKLRIHIGARLPLDQAAEAHARLDRGGNIGKIVLTRIG